MKSKCDTVCEESGDSDWESESEMDPTLGSSILHRLGSAANDL